METHLQTKGQMNPIIDKAGANQEQQSRKKNS